MADNRSIGTGHAGPRSFAFGQGHTLVAPTNLGTTTINLPAGLYLIAVTSTEAVELKRGATSLTPGGGASGGTILPGGTQLLHYQDATQAYAFASATGAGRIMFTPCER